ncbi:hypothetical protein RIF29_27089 [Crotalaria pallida]|uniref:Uncharacterized protein n=1 Tax=Crotalaria pallida TaxID=3830 RepID=A0AAN9EQS6_CROPI
MATKAKENTIVGKEEKAASSDSHNLKHQRLHNALVSPREKKLSFRSSIVPVRNTKPSKLIPDRTSTNLRRGKIKQVYVVKSTHSASPATTTKKVANDDNNAFANDSEKSNAETKDVSNVVTEEVINQEVETMKVENEEIIKVEHAYEVSKHDENEHEREDEHEQGLEKFDQLHNQTIDEKVIYVGKEDEEEAKSEAQEKKTCDQCSCLTAAHLVRLTRSMHTPSTHLL